MKRLVRVTADDFGLTRGITDSLMQCAREGTLDQVSMMGNGDAFDYAVEAFALHTKPLDMALHLNITEGAALSVPTQIPHLVDARGFFRSGPIGLWVRYLCSLPPARRALRREVALEMLAQWKRLQNALSKHGHLVTRLDAHQHVHMIPFVFNEVVKLPGIASVRASGEPFYFVPTDWTAYFGFRTISRVVLWFLSKRNTRIAQKRGIVSNKYALGILFAGRMTYACVAAGLSHIATLSAGPVEIIMHPGIAEPDELSSWRGNRANRAWHFSPARRKEQQLVLSGEFSRLVRDFSEDVLSPARFDAARIIRFIIAGASAAALNLGALYLCTELFHLWYVYSAVLAFAISLVLSFILQKFWTFGEQNTKGLRTQFIAYAALQTLNLGIDAVGIYFLVQFVGLWYMFAQFIMLAAISVWTYFIFRRFLFQEVV